MYAYDEIKWLRLEITDRCNASCPQCSRSDHGGALNPLLSITELTLDDVKKIFPEAFVRQLELIMLCGNYGDALMGRDTLEICRYFRRANPNVIIGFHTNGSARSADWWQAMARVLQPGYCHFGIDGLEDTNHIYRRGTRFDVIMESARAFIAAGGRAEWDFIVFAHNEHQIEEARERARKMGFIYFRLKETPKFFDNSTFVAQDEYPVKDKQGRIIDRLRPPTTWSPDSIHVRFDALTRKTGGFRGYLEETPIACQVVEQRSIYVTADGCVVPCCYLGSLERIAEWNGMEELNAKKRPIREILEGPLFQKTIPEGWERGPKRNLTCARICGEVKRPTGS